MKILHRKYGLMTHLNTLMSFEGYSFADEVFELKPGSVHVLNIPDAMANSADDFFDAYNKDFVDVVIRNKDKVNPVLVSDPRIPHLAQVLDGARDVRDLCLLLVKV